MVNGSWTRSPTLATLLFHINGRKYVDSVNAPSDADDHVGVVFLEGGQTSGQLTNSSLLKTANADHSSAKDQTAVDLARSEASNSCNNGGNYVGMPEFQW